MKRTDKAAELARKAMSERLIAEEYAESGIDPGSTVFHHMYAEELRKEANDLLALDQLPQLGHGGEVVPTKDEKLGVAMAGAIAHNSLDNPDMISIDSSKQRLELLMDANVVAPGLDAAESINAGNSLEKMLAHQMVLCHSAAFRTISKANNQMDTVESARLLNAGTRLMKTFQEGLQTLHKIRNGNRQTMIVQHVNVSDGGQAVVAGEVGRAGKGEGK